MPRRDDEMASLVEEEGPELGSGAGELTGDFVELPTAVMEMTREAAELTIEQVNRYSPEMLRERIPYWLAHHILEHSDMRDGVFASVQRALEQCSDVDMEQLLANFRGAGERMRFQPYDPVAQWVSRSFLREIPEQEVVFGADLLLDALDAGPCALVGNSLSYADAAFTDLLLFLYGHEPSADRLVYAAPPGIYDNPYRRLSALSLNTLPIAPLSGRADLRSAEEISQALLDTARQAIGLTLNGFGLVLYAEGRRSRSGRMGSFRREIASYLSVDGLTLLPVALTGTDVAFPPHKHQLMPAAITLSIGEPVAVQGLHGREALITCWERVVEMLPPEYRPEDGTPPLCENP